MRPIPKYAGFTATKARLDVGENTGRLVSSLTSLAVMSDEVTFVAPKADGNWDQSQDH
jgi:hypothetical protein